MHPPPDSVTRLAAAVLVLFEVQLFVALLLTDGYSLDTTLAAASTVAVIAAEITTRILGGDGPGSRRPPRLPAVCG
jgi:hypothetical protein